MSTPMWAPWRMNYILGLTGPKPATTGCFFCDHAKDTASFRENLVLVVQEHALVCLNRYPFTTSHLLVAPRRHVADPSDLEPAEYDALMHLLRDTIARLKKAVGCEAMNVGFNLGKVAGAGVADHLHGHCVPRWNGDTNFMPVIAGATVVPQALEELANQLRAVLAS